MYVMIMYFDVFRFSTIFILIYHLWFGMTLSNFDPYPLDQRIPRQVGGMCRLQTAGVAYASHCRSPSQTKHRQTTGDGTPTPIWQHLHIYDHVGLIRVIV